MQNGYTSWQATLASGRDIPHYYGDYVRPLFIAMAVLSFVVTPLWGDMLPFGIIAQVGASLLLVVLAGLTNAKSLRIMLVNATVAGVSVVLLESYAIILRSVGPHQNELFLARELGVILMLVALYFSVKTARSMLTGKIGHPDSPLEFDEQEVTVEEVHTPEPFDPME
jgi:hypothetical protein